MTLTPAERYDYLVKVLALGNQHTFADVTGINYYALNRIINGKINYNPLTPKYIDPILKAYPEVNRNWLLTGEGEPGVAPRPDDVVAQLKRAIAEKDNLIEELQAELKMQRKVIEKLLG